jgi:hypothetical protein
MSQYKIQNVFLYKNNQFVGSANINNSTGSFSTIDSAKYQVIVVAIDQNGKTYYTTIETNLGVDGFKFSNTIGYSKPEVAGMFNDITEVYSLSQDVSYSFGNFMIGAKTPMRVIKGELTSNIPTVQSSFGDILDNTQTTSLRADSDYKVYAKYEIKF